MDMVKRISHNLVPVNRKGLDATDTIKSHVLHHINQTTKKSHVTLGVANHIYIQVVSQHAIMAYSKSSGTAPLLLNLGTRWR